MKNFIAFAVVTAVLPLLFATSALAATTITVSWAPVVGNAGYVVEVKTATCADVASWGSIGTAPVDVTTLTGGNYGPNLPLCVRVAALKPGSIIQTWSTPVNFITAGPLPAPNPVSVSEP